MGLAAKFDALNNADLSKLNGRVADLRQQIQDALALKEKLATEQAAVQKTAASSKQTASPDELLDALTTAQKRMK